MCPDASAPQHDIPETSPAPVNAAPPELDQDEQAAEDKPEQEKQPEGPTEGAQAQQDQSPLSAEEIAKFKARRNERQARVEMLAAMINGPGAQPGTAITLGDVPIWELPICGCVLDPHNRVWRVDRGPSGRETKLVLAGHLLK